MQKKIKRRSKYYAPQNEGCERECDCVGCHERGEYRAPKDRKLKEYYWFCLKHVQEYNAKWNYYDGTSPDEEAENEQKRTRRFRFSSGVKYNFGFDAKGDFRFFDDYNPDFSAADSRFSTAEDIQSLKVMELQAEGLTLDVLKKQYKKLVKKYHPDVNQNDKSAEEKFKLISVAYKHLSRKLT